MLDRVVPAGFEDVVETDDVALYVDVGVVDAVAHAGLGGEIDHHVELVFLEQLVDEVSVCNRSFDESVVHPRVPAAFGVQFAETVFFEGDVVVAVEVVETYKGATGHLV